MEMYTVVHLDLHLVVYTIIKKPIEYIIFICNVSFMYTVALILCYEL